MKVKGESRTTRGFWSEQQVDGSIIYQNKEDLGESSFGNREREKKTVVLFAFLSVSLLLDIST